MQYLEATLEMACRHGITVNGNMNILSNCPDCIERLHPVSVYSLGLKVNLYTHRGQGCYTKNRGCHLQFTGNVELVGVDTLKRLLIVTRRLLFYSHLAQPPEEWPHR